MLRIRDANFYSRPLARRARCCALVMQRARYYGLLSAVGKCKPDHQKRQTRHSGGSADIRARTLYLRRILMTSAPARSRSQ